MGLLFHVEPFRVVQQQNQKECLIHALDFQCKFVVLEYLFSRKYERINRKLFYNCKSGGIRATQPQFMPQVSKIEKPKPKLNMNLMRANRISDIDRLRKAYASESRAYVHGDTM